MMVNIMRVRSTHRQQLNTCRALIAKQRNALRRAEQALDYAVETREDTSQIFWHKARCNAARDIMLRTADHYANLIRFRRECERRALERKINAAMSRFAFWAANGLPTGGSNGKSRS